MARANKPPEVSDPHMARLSFSNRVQLASWGRAASGSCPQNSASMISNKEHSKVRFVREWQPLRKRFWREGEESVREERLLERDKVVMEEEERERDSKREHSDKVNEVNIGHSTCTHT